MALDTNTIIGFQELGLSEPLLKAVAEAGYVTPTPIQSQVIPVFLTGKDIVGQAQTGTGKTAAVALIIGRVEVGGYRKLVVAM